MTDTITQIITPFAPVLLHSFHTNDQTVDQRRGILYDFMIFMSIVILVSFTLAMNRSNFKFKASWIVSLLFPVYYLLYVVIETGMKYGVASIIDLKHLSTFRTFK